MQVLLQKPLSLKLFLDREFLEESAVKAGHHLSVLLSNKLNIEYFGIDMRQRCAYHPASGGAVEQENANLSSTLSDIHNQVKTA